ncbi:MAG: substrate-binding domain-containing protein [Acidobacteria bacterium]|nr:substrate-binding domain-containing protein [Acidobacteriota bacterium]
MTRRRMPLLRAISVAIATLAAAGSAAAEEATLLLVTTTSVRDSGLLDALLPVFRQRSGVRVQVIAVGSGAALRMGSDGNADALLTHAPDGEEALVASGAVVARVPFMDNHFVIAGPAADPARVGEASSPADALRRIASAAAPFVSRGDDSGTHRREVALFEEAGLDPNGRWEGFARTGSGMGLTLQVAGERRAYVLSDVGTFLAFRERVDLVELSRPTPSLRNVYSILRVDPKRLKPAAAAAAERFEAFLLHPDTQRRIRDFGRERYGRALFRPLHLEDEVAPP